MVFAFNLGPAVKMNEENVVLYRKGFPYGSGCAWFRDVRDAINYDGCVLDNKIYYLPVGKDKFLRYFRENGIGYVLKESERRIWESISLRIKVVPSCLVERILC